MSDDNAPAAQASPARIHDLGYKRYVGTRRPQRTRYWAIVKNLLTMSWRGWWRMKSWVISAAITTVAIGVAMYISRNEMFRQLERAGMPLSFTDALLPLSIVYYSKVAFMLSVTVGAAVIARDLEAGAFEFYFSRPVRPIDYLVGKVGGMVLVMAPALLVGPVLLAAFRLGLVDDTAALGDHAWLVPKALLLGIVSTLAYAVIPLAFSAISNNKRHTVAAWLGFYLLAGTIAAAIGRTTDMPAIGALDISMALRSISMHVFDVQILGRAMPPLGASIAAIAGYIAVSLGFIYWRIARAERAGMGGG